MVRVALISRDPGIRLAAAEVFDAAPAAWVVEVHETPPEDASVLVFGSDVEGDAGVRFDPAAPERLLDDVRRALSHDGSRAVVVTSPGGGTGVTTVSLHLAEVAARRVTCWLDLSFGSYTGQRLGLRGDHVKTWGDVDSSEASMRLAALPVSAGFRALLAPDSDPGIDISYLLHRARQEFERLLIDVPAGPALASALSHADVAVLVMAPSLVGARRAKVLLDSFPDVQWAVVTNRTGPGGESTRAQLQAIVERRIVLELPCSAALRDAEDDGRLMTSPWSPWRRAIVRLAKALDCA